MLEAHAYVMQVKLCKANTRGVTTIASYGHRCSVRSVGDDDLRLKMRYLRVRHRSLNKRSLFVLILFLFIPVALVSCRRDLRSRAISFHVTCF